jgi:hypothetical protein
MPGYLITDRTIEKVKGLVERLMDFTCSIERAATSTTDDYGQDVPSGWVVAHAGVICSYKASSIEKNQRTSEFVETDPQMKMPLGTDVLLTDRITAVKDRHGIAVEPGTFEIKSITPRMGNLLLVLSSTGQA